MLSLSDNNQIVYVEAFNSISRYLDGLLHINYPCFEHFDTDASFLYLYFSLTKGILSSKIKNKRDDLILV